MSISTHLFLNSPWFVVAEKIYIHKRLTQPAKRVHRSCKGGEIL